VSAHLAPGTVVRYVGERYRDLIGLEGEVTTVNGEFAVEWRNPYGAPHGDPDPSLQYPPRDLQVLRGFSVRFQNAMEQAGTSAFVRGGMTKDQALAFVRTLDRSFRRKTLLEVAKAAASADEGWLRNEAKARRLFAEAIGGNHLVIDAVMADVKASMKPARSS